MPPTPHYVLPYYFLLQVNLDIPEKAQVPDGAKLASWVETQLLTMRQFQERKIGVVMATALSTDTALALSKPRDDKSPEEVAAQLLTPRTSAPTTTPTPAPPQSAPEFLAALSPRSYARLSEEERQDLREGSLIDRVAARHETRADADNSFHAIAVRTAALVEEKNHAYGDSFAQSAKVLGVIFPEGVKPENYENLLAVTRILDKLFRIGTGRADSEDPARDITGYGLLMQRSAALKREGK